MTQTPEKHSSSWIQLLLFTAFLFLLVAIPYTIYTKSSEPKPVRSLTVLPVAKVSPFPSIIPPPASTTTVCIPVPATYQTPSSTPSAYLFQDDKRQLCYPPSLPPFPFTWQSYTSSQYGYTLNTPSNWIDKSTSVKGTQIHLFTSEENPSASIAASISFAWYEGPDPYATQAAYLKNPIMRSGKNGTVYTKGSTFVAAVFPLQSGFFILESLRLDSAFYAFEQILDSLKFQ